MVCFPNKLETCKKINGVSSTSRRFIFRLCASFLLILFCGAYQVFAEDPLQIGERFKDCGVCPEMIVIPGGEIVVKGVSAVAEEGVQILSLPDRFAISIYEITNADWENCEFLEGCKRPDSNQESADKDFGWREWKSTRPVVNITWAESVMYTIWLSSVAGENYWLPTELEWEYAARGGLVEEIPWSGLNENSCEFANLSLHEGCSDRYRGSAPVGSYNANGYGLYDMIGNVSEWTASCSGNVLGSTVDLHRHRVGDSFKLSEYGKEVPNCGAMVNRGGNWSSQVESFEYTARSALPRGANSETVGFRVVRSVK
tara:strand:+ start:574 stop:1515 length:942 start_codon:yes stop_codon:yes gene_type:complete